jgi:HK97 family phage prohead protease
MIRGVVAAEIRALGDDEVEVIMSTGMIARDGHILVPQGAILDNYRNNPIFLWQHDQRIPVGRAEEIAIEGDKIRARVRFAPTGISADADKVRGLVKSDIVRAVSVGFDPLDGEPLDPKKPKGGQRFTRWELLECSFVSVPADPGAVVTARDMETPDMTEGTTAATATRAAEPIYYANIRGLWDVARLACLLEDLGWEQACARFEAELEGDGSAVPGMLANALSSLGEALITMTQEEVGEFLEGRGIEIDEDEELDELDDDDRATVAASANPALKRFRLAVRRARRLQKRDDDAAGEITMSAGAIARCREHLAHHESAMENHRAAMRAHKRAADCIRSIPGVGDGDENDGQQIQTSAGTAKSDGSEGDRAAEALARTADIDRLRRLGELNARSLS